VLRRVEAVLAAVAALVLKVLPDGVSLELREKLVLRRPLDYDQAVIALQITSRTEKEVRLRSCQKEPETVEWIQRTLKPGDVFYDIGANVGAYSLIAAQWTRRQATVYAFEPGYTTFPDLVENIFVNGCDEAVIPLPVALGAETALMKFQYATLEPGGATHGGIMGERKDASNIRKQALASYRMDDFVGLLRLRPPTHMKIDVDGAELRVLQGAEKTLRSPGLRWILVEVAMTGGQARLVKDLLEEQGFYLENDHPHGDGITHNWIFARDRRSGVSAAADVTEMVGMVEPAGQKASRPPGRQTDALNSPRQGDGTLRR
jgi:FkbM family methyltransferase